MIRATVLSTAIVVMLGMAGTSMAVSTPVAQYEFEDNFDDSSGNGNNAALTSGTVTFMDDSLNFTRAGLWPTNVDPPPDVIQAPDNVGSAQSYDMGVYGYAHDLTVSFLVNPYSVSGHDNNHWICWKADEINNRGWGLVIDMDSRRPVFFYWDDRERTIQGDNLTEYGMWQHWTFVWHTAAGPGTGDYEWYYNGQLVEFAAGNSDNLFASPGTPLKIGSKGNMFEADEDLAGGLDSLKIWHEALSAADVWQVYKDSLPPCATGVDPSVLADPTVTASLGQVGSPNPVPLTVKSMGSNPVNWSVAVVGGMPSWITSITPQNGQFTEPWPHASSTTTVNVSIDASGQAAGVHTATLQFTNDCSPAQPPIERVITLNVDPCNFTALPESINSLPGAGCPGSQVHDITVTNTTPTGGSNVTYSVVEIDRNGAEADVPWLSTDKTGGQDIAPGATDTVKATVDYTRLEVGVNVARLRFRSTCDVYEVHDVEFIAPFILNYNGDVDPETANAGGPGMTFTEREGDADEYRNTVPPSLVVEPNALALDGYELKITDNETRKLKLRTRPSQNIGGETGATIVGRVRTTFKFGNNIEGENLSIWHDGGGSLGCHWSGAGDITGQGQGIPGYLKETARGDNHTFTDQALDWYAGYHIIRACMGQVNGSRAIRIYFDENPTPVIEILTASNKASATDSIGFGTGSTVGQQVIYFDWVTGTNAGMFAPGEEVDCIGRSLCLGPGCYDSPCNLDLFADADEDGDVDQADFAMFQRCYTGDGGGVPADPDYCQCFDRRNNDNTPGEDNDVDGFDLGAFEDCASGPGVAADPACDG